MGDQSKSSEVPLGNTSEKPQELEKDQGPGGRGDKAEKVPHAAFPGKSQGGLYVPSQES